MGALVEYQGESRFEKYKYNTPDVIIRQDTCLLHRTKELQVDLQGKISHSRLVPKMRTHRSFHLVAFASSDFFKLSPIASFCV